MPPIKVGFPPTDVYMEPLPCPTDSSCEPGPDAARDGRLNSPTVLGIQCSFWHLLHLSALSLSLSHPWPLIKLELVSESPGGIFKECPGGSWLLYLDTVGWTGDVHVQQIPRSRHWWCRGHRRRKAVTILPECLFLCLFSMVTATSWARALTNV